MAHNLETRNGQTSFAATLHNGQRAWHGLGQYVDKAMTAEEAITLANMDWTVEKQPMLIDNPAFATDPENQPMQVEVPRFKAAVRMDTGDVLSVVSDTYQIVQNRECFTFFDTIVDRGEAIYETAGVLGRGERIFLTAKLPKDIVVNGEQVENYILLTNGHDALHSLQAGFTSVRVVCNNTLTAALNGGLKNSIKLRHTANVKEMLKEAATIMGISSRYVQEAQEAFDAMARVRINDVQLRRFIELVMHPEPETIGEKEFSKQFIKTVDNVMEFALAHDTQLTQAAAGTVWGAYNAISGYYGHVKEHKTASARMNDILFGQGDQRIKQAYDLATATVKNTNILN